jgi:[CysO sulfur-carrier protein]-S-L-cysteine hydrolase
MYKKVQTQVPRRWIFSHYEVKQPSPRLPDRSVETKGIKNKKENYQAFYIKKSVYEEIIAYCKQALPYEACGLLSGINETGNTLWKIKNESVRLNRFYMSQEAIKRAVMEMNEKDENLTGIFHSHPTSPAFPSSQDIENNPYDQIAYFIVSFYKGKVDVGCFKLNNKKVIPVKLNIIDE